MNHRLAQLLFAATLAILLFVDGTLGFSYFNVLIPIVIYLFFLIGGSYFIQWNFFVSSVNSGDRRSNKIALTFDDGPIKSATPAILEILKTENVKAAFFVIGQQAEKHPHIIEAIKADGHLLGNHSYSHNFWFSMKSSADMLEDMQRCSDVILKVSGESNKYFRPPYGVTNPMVASAVKKGNYTSIGWSLRSMDTVIDDESKLLKKLQNVKGGDIILLHDYGKQTLKVLPGFISYARSKGLQFVRLDEML